MTQEVYEGDKRLNFTATNTTLKSGSLLGVLVASADTGTLKFADPDGTIVNTMSVAAGTFYRIPCRFKGGLTITVGGTVDATVFYKT